MKRRSVRRARRFSRALLACACAVACVMAPAGCSKSKPPTATARYEDEGTVTDTGLTLHRYVWDGEAPDVYAPLEMADEDVVDLEISGTDAVSVSFSEDVRRAEVWRYLDDPDGESVECDLEDGTVSFVPEPGWRYLVYAQFMNGEADYLLDAGEAA